MTIGCPIYCINICDRLDRKLHVEMQFNKLNIFNVHFPHVQKDERGGKYGCYDSHVKIWKDFYEKNLCNYCLIFEDDFTYSNKDMNNILLKAEEFIKKNYKQVDLLFMHNLFCSTYSALNNKDFSNGMGFHAHVYFISRNYIENLVNKYDYNWMNPDGLDLDITLNINRKHMIYSDKIYYMQTDGFIQSDSDSDNVSNILELLSRDKVYYMKGVKIIRLCYTLMPIIDKHFKDILFNIYKNAIDILPK
jgi:GR25 family glycosyltransferase involved in LPS biosynthesis